MFDIDTNRKCSKFTTISDIPDDFCWSNMRLFVERVSYVPVFKGDNLFSSR